MSINSKFERSGVCNQYFPFENNQAGEKLNGENIKRKTTDDNASLTSLDIAIENYYNSRMLEVTSNSEVIKESYLDSHQQIDNHQIIDKNLLICDESKLSGSSTNSNFRNLFYNLKDASSKLKEDNPNGLKVQIFHTASSNIDFELSNSDSRRILSTNSNQTKQQTKFGSFNQMKLLKKGADRFEKAKSSLRNQEGQHEESVMSGLSLTAINKSNSIQQERISFLKKRLDLYMNESSE